MLDFIGTSEVCLLHLSDLLYLVQKSSISRKINHTTDFPNLLLSAIEGISTTLPNAYILKLHEYVWVTFAFTEALSVPGPAKFWKVSWNALH